MTRPWSVGAAVGGHSTLGQGVERGRAGALRRASFILDDDFDDADTDGGECDESGTTAE